MRASEFWLSVSTQCFTDKNSISWGGVQYTKHRMNVAQFIELVKKGYCFCHCFDVPLYSRVTQKDKCNAKFKEAYMLFVDIDDSIIAMDEFITKLSYKPTVAYTTPNNHTEKSSWMYRFRLCYLLNQPITDVETYKRAYRSLVNGIEKDIDGFCNKDNCGQSASQQFSGNGSGKCELWQSDEVYNQTDFIISEPTRKESATTPHKLSNVFNATSVSDFQFMADLNKLSPFDLIRKYQNVYPFFDKTPLEYKDGYAILPENYTEIKRKCTFDSFFKDNGEVKTWLKVKKIRDGEGRKKKLYTAGLIRKQILPTVTLEHLLFNFIVDRTYFYDNSDKELSNTRLLDMAKRVIATPLQEIHIPLFRPKEFEVDKEYCRLHGISPNEMKNRVRKILKDQQIGECYDCAMTVKDNLKLMKEMGMKISKSRLYEWCNENGIPTDPFRKIDMVDRNICYCIQHTSTISAA